MKIFSFLLFSHFLLLIEVNAQEIVRGNCNIWLLNINRIQFSEKCSFTNEIHERTSNLLSEQAQFLVRPSLDFHWNKNTETSSGYSYIHVWPYLPYTLPIQKTENNIWEQVLLKQEIGKVKIQYRFRQEHRWFDHIEFLNGEYRKNGIDFSNRFRMRFILTYDIYHFKNKNKCLFLNLWDELWFNQDTHLRPDDFARNWMYAGLGIKFNSKTNLQMAYLNQLDKINSIKFIQSNIIQLTFQRNFLFEKSPEK